MGNQRSLGTIDNQQTTWGACLLACCLVTVGTVHLAALEGTEASLHSYRMSPVQMKRFFFQELFPSSKMLHLAPVLCQGLYPGWNMPRSYNHSAAQLFLEIGHLQLCPLAHLQGFCKRGLVLLCKAWSHMSFFTPKSVLGIPHSLWKMLLPVECRGSSCPPSVPYLPHAEGRANLSRRAVVNHCCSSDPSWPGADLLYEQDK